MNYRRALPNICTASNLIGGMLSILATMRGDFFYGAVFIFLALVADGLDGRVARYFGVASEFGKEMDSLCDVCSFGVAPAVLAWQFALHHYGVMGVVVTIFFAVCGMWRLTRFNVSTEVVHGYFMGLAIPAGGNLIAMSILLLSELGINPLIFGSNYLIYVALVAYLMVSRIHYPDFKGDGEKVYLPSKIFVAVIFALVLYSGREAIVPAIFTGIFLSYALLGIVNSLIAAFALQKG